MILPNGNYLLAVFPVLFMFILFVLYLQSSSWREAILQSSIIWGITTVLISEGLSVFKQLTFINLIFIWFLGDILIGLILYTRVKKDGFKSINKPFFNLKNIYFFVFAGILIYILITGMIAFMAPPNTTDSLTYHMSRVMHWIENQSVAAYPTTISRQIYIPPWTEYGILQFQLLTGSDRFANSIQWFSFIGCIVGVSLIARELGADTIGQFFSSVFCVTIPIAILEASSAQTDLTTAFWLVCFVYFCIHTLTQKDNSDILWTGCSLGLAVLSKTTAYLFAFPFVLLILVRVLVSPRQEQLWRWAIATAIILGINSGQYIRSYQIYNNPLGPTQVDGLKITNDIITPASITSNVVRNIVTNLWTPFDVVNRYIYDISDQIHQAIGLDENDPRTTYGQTFGIHPISLYEATAGNLLHTLLITALLIYCIIAFKERQRRVIIYVAEVLFGFLIFCAALKWQLWIPRLQAPLFILMSPIFGIVASQIKPKFIPKTIVALLFIAATPWLVAGQPRPLIGSNSVLLVERNVQYFSYYPALYEPYMLAAKRIEKMKASNVGLVTGWSDAEYPLWVYLRNYNKQLPRIEEVDVSNETKIIAVNDSYFRLFVPDVLVVTVPSILSQSSWTLDNKIYQRVWQSHYIALFVPTK
jgi:4-amino-4-deoxy-L-arabinose transferase-like glycosyltransferase